MQKLNKWFIFHTITTTMQKKKNVAQVTSFQETKPCNIFFFLDYSPRR